MRISDWSSDVCSSDLNPQNDSQPRLWGLQVVETQAMTAGNFLTGAFRLGAQIFDWQDARVEVSTEDSDNFRKNLVTILAEARLALAVYRHELGRASRRERWCQSVSFSVDAVAVNKKIHTYTGT